MSLAPVARILLRYGVGFFAGQAVGDMLSADSDVVLIVALGLGVVVEAAYAEAKKRGWAT